VVAKVRRVFMTKAVGHAGTLDPMADGLLILLLGEATKFSHYIMGQDKKYSAEIQLGLETDSWDAEGELLTSPEVHGLKNMDLTEAHILKAVSDMQGDLSLQVPIHSAVKIQGQKLYDYARKGKAIVPPTRVMKFYRSELKNFVSNPAFFIKGADYQTLQLNVDLDCEKGSYIRSWVHHLGKNLGCGALMSGLTRHQSGAFNLDGAVDYNELLKIDQLRMDFKKQPEHSELKDQIAQNLLKLSQQIIDLKTCIHGPFFRVVPSEIKLLKNGQIPNDLNLRMRPLLKNCQNQNTSLLIRVFDSSLQNMIAILELAPTGRPKIIRAFQN
jgi:tRNA pseudouridine55 synthase